MTNENRKHVNKAQVSNISQQVNSRVERGYAHKCLYVKAIFKMVSFRCETPLPLLQHASNLFTLASRTFKVSNASRLPQNRPSSGKHLHRTSHNSPTSESEQTQASKMAPMKRPRRDADEEIVEVETASSSLRQDGVSSLPMNTATASSTKSSLYIC